MSETEKMPQVQVLKFEPELTHSVWTDYAYRSRTRRTLDKHLQSLIKNGTYVGFRLIHIEYQQVGIATVTTFRRRKKLTQ